MKTNTEITTTVSPFDLNALHNEIEYDKQRLMQSTAPIIEKAIRLGEMLIAAKKAIGYGNWLTWISENLQFDQSQVWRYTQLSNYARAHNLDGATSIKSALLLCGGEKEIKEKQLNDPFAPTSWVSKLATRFLQRAEKTKDWQETEKADLAETIRQLILLARKLGVSNDKKSIEY